MAPRPCPSLCVPRTRAQAGSQTLIGPSGTSFAEEPTVAPVCGMHMPREKPLWMRGGILLVGMLRGRGKKAPPSSSGLPLSRGDAPHRRVDYYDLTGITNFGMAQPAKIPSKAGKTVLEKVSSMQTRTKISFGSRIVSGGNSVLTSRVLRSLGAGFPR